MSVENYLNSLLKEKYGEGSRYIEGGKVLLPNGSLCDLPIDLRKLAIEVEEERRFGPDRFKDRALKNLFVLLRLEGARISWKNFLDIYGNLPPAKIYEDFHDLLYLKDYLTTRLELLCTVKLKNYPTNLGKDIESVVEKSYENGRLKELLNEVEKLEKRPNRSIEAKILNNFPSELYLEEERLVLK
jgi:hypothetical protein